MTQSPTDTLRHIVMDSAKIARLGQIEPGDVRKLAEMVRALAEAVLQLELAREE